MQGEQVRSLFRELRFHMLSDHEKKKKENDQTQNICVSEGEKLSGPM